MNSFSPLVHYAICHVIICVIWFIELLFLIVDEMVKKLSDETKTSKNKFEIVYKTVAKVLLSITTFL
jgi:hypothetical protein